MVSTMTPVTDPNILAQLNGSSGMKPVTDPNVLAQLNSNQAMAQPPAPQGVANSPLVNGVLGAGDAIRDTLKNLYDASPNLFGEDFSFSSLKPNMNYAQVGNALNKAPTPLPPSSGGLAYDVGNFGGNVAAFAPAVMAAGANKARQGIVGATYGAINNPNNRFLGGLIGAGSAVIPPALISSGAKLINAFRPQKYAEGIINDLSGGRSLEQNAQSIAQDINNSFGRQMQNSAADYKPVFDAAGNSSIYNGVNQQLARVPANNFKNLDEAIDYINDQHGLDLNTPKDLKDFLQNQNGYSFNSNKALLDFFNSYPATVNAGKYSSLGDDIFNSYDRNLKNLNQQFNTAPTLQNAHNLQSQLGSVVRKLQSQDAIGNLSVADRSTMQGYQNAQDALRSDINDFLTRKNPALANQYQTATNNYLNNVVPYFENPKLASIAKGDTVNPDNITNLFKSPEPEIQKVVNDLGDGAKNKILYSQLGKLKGTLTPEKLVDGINNLDKNGLGSYVTPTLSQQLNNLTSRLANRNVIPWSGKLANAYRFAGSKNSINQVGSGLSSSVGAAYPYISQETIANMLNQYFNEGRQQ
jgi:hypothetical protein